MHGSSPNCPVSRSNGEPTTVPLDCLIGCEEILLSFLIKVGQRTHETPPRSEVLVIVPVLAEI